MSKDILVEGSKQMGVGSGTASETGANNPQVREPVSIYRQSAIDAAARQAKLMGAIAHILITWQEL